MSQEFNLYFKKLSGFKMQVKHSENQALFNVLLKVSFLFKKDSQPKVAVRI